MQDSVTMSKGFNVRSRLKFIWHIEIFFNHHISFVIWMISLTTCSLPAISAFIKGAWGYISQKDVDQQLEKGFERKLVAP